jgi:hypothetical protein
MSLEDLRAIASQRRRAQSKHQGMRQERRGALLFPVLARNVEASRAEALGRRHESRVGQSVTREFGSALTHGAKRDRAASKRRTANGQPEGGYQNRQYCYDRRLSISALSAASIVRYEASAAITRDRASAMQPVSPTPSISAHRSASS